MSTGGDDKTKARLKRVALDLFSEQGYDGTSMREIAESLGVTKAALYYHYPSKGDIVRDLMSDYVAAIDDLIDWAGSDPAPSVDEILRRWVELVKGHGARLIRFMHANQHVLRDVIDKSHGLARMRGLFDAVAGPDAEYEDQLRARMAVLSVHMAAIAAQDLGMEDDEAFAIALKVALDTLTPSGG